MSTGESLYSPTVEKKSWRHEMLKYISGVGAIVLLLLVAGHSLWGYISLPVMKVTPDGQCSQYLVWQGRAQVPTPCAEATGRYRIDHIPFPGMRTGQ